MSPYAPVKWPVYGYLSNFTKSGTTKCVASPSALWHWIRLSDWPVFGMCKKCKTMFQCQKPGVWVTPEMFCAPPNCTAAQHHSDGFSPEARDAPTLPASKPEPWAEVYQRIKHFSLDSGGVLHGPSSLIFDPWPNGSVSIEFDSLSPFLPRARSCLGDVERSCFHVPWGTTGGRELPKDDQIQNQKRTFFGMNIQHHPASSSIIQHHPASSSIIQHHPAIPASFTVHQDTRVFRCFSTRLPWPCSFPMLSRGISFHRRWKAIAHQSSLRRRPNCHWILHQTCLKKWGGLLTKSINFRVFWSMNFWPILLPTNMINTNDCWSWTGWTGKANRRNVQRRTIFLPRHGSNRVNIWGPNSSLAVSPDTNCAWLKIVTMVYIHIHTVYIL